MRMAAPLPGLDSSLAFQLARYGFISTVLHLYTKRKVASFSVGLVIFLTLVTIGLLSRQWLSVVAKHAPEPYLDEVFHIPQAQVYCDGKYAVWDDKITTPPGLYALTILSNNILIGFPCSVYYLRLFNVEIISYLALAAIIAKARLEQPVKEVRYSVNAVWTGINVALFPVLFFFSGLYYTDVISTFVVLLAYANHLSRVNSRERSLKNDVSTLFLGLLALCMRQTNIFWVVVYMGGLEVVHSIKSLNPLPVATPAFTTLPDQVRFYAWRYSLGDIHDPSLNLASPIDVVLSAVSISIAALCNLGTIVRQRIWPHLLVLSAFIGFVAWNGGVVLGDKSNHIATLHLAQMLYIWPLFAFFSAPLFIPRLLDLAVHVFNVITGASGSTLVSKGSPTIRSTSKGTNGSSQSIGLKVFNSLGSSHIAHSIIVLAGALVVATLIVRYNTIIHPFTLADNRHYMFYIFRYTILRAQWIRYALVPVYVVCGWMCWAALQGSPLVSVYSQSSPRARQWIQTPFRHPTAVANSSVDPKQHPNASHELSESKGDRAMTPPPTSTVLMLLLASALSLVTAPLVEPRYFILPWVFWRLLVPARPALVLLTPPSYMAVLSQRLIIPALETLWFALVNVATMYVFVAQPFYWRAPDGELLDGGRVQRFMW
ncbi:glycosyltransferase family 59 protein [Hypomontagnella monticulosa]|nr:glycosyltransferase family 59 protein [Hypomontagnella monticulosa]